MQGHPVGGALVAAFVHDGTANPDERLENALLYRALRRRLGTRLTGYATTSDVPRGVRAVFGRTCPRRLASRHGPGALVYPAADALEMPYWTDPTFLAAAGRRITVHGLAEAEHAVAAIHARDRKAFVKATKPKLFAQTVDPGSTLLQALGPLAYSLIETPDCLMVQDHIDLVDEYRFFVVAGRIVTGAGAIESDTPAENRHVFANEVEGRRGSGKRRNDPALMTAYLEFAHDFVSAREPGTYVLDVASAAGQTCVVEINPLYLGRVGLYGCDVQRLVDAVLETLDESLKDAPRQAISSGWGTGRPAAA